jgi:hypothetical protein
MYCFIQPKNVDHNCHHCLFLGFGWYFLHYLKVFFTFLQNWNFKKSAPGAKARVEVAAHHAAEHAAPDAALIT